MNEQNKKRKFKTTRRKNTLNNGMKSCWCQAPQIQTRIFRRIVNSNLMMEFMMNHSQCNTISDFDIMYINGNYAKIVERQITQIMQITSRWIQTKKNTHRFNKQQIKTKLQKYANNKEISNLNATLYTNNKKM